ncbi:O-antigen ligase [Rhodovulum sulfidophilum]|uniref:hypothetical protein n=1 Tax=Rhodovulum sulfidophilum TaxID=35806 RepID=UPI0005A691FD|nr:hypothetical protein [Rhodovulum sulfidophilum]ANB34411.1 hypothetical protein A6W98_10195 [Rhodovulum sulfidophilum DSM 1374]ANB38234.1 hypothetical protein A6024_10055 [Rhodovulum sulfidophilum]MCW2305461.1 O-antigen ligase [Rhodovulum sulfidophilum]
MILSRSNTSYDAGFLLVSLAFFFRYVLDGIGLGIVGSLILLIATVLLMLEKKEIIVSQRVFIFLFISGVILLFSGFHVYVQYGTLKFFALEVIRFATYISAYILVRNGRIDFFKIYRLFLILLCIQVPILFFQKFGLGMDRPAGTLTNNNHLMYLTGLLLLLQFGLKRVPAFHFALPVSLLILLGGVGGALFASIAIWIHITMAVAIRGKAKAFIFQVLAIAMMSTVVFVHWDKIGYAIESNTPEVVASRLEAGDRYGGGTIGARIFFWHYFSSQVFSEPMSTAIGLGSGAASNRSTYFAGWGSQDPHDEYVRVLTDYGLIGLGVFVAFWLSVVFGFLRSAIKRRSNGALLAHSIVWFFLMGCTIANVFVQSTFMWLLIMLLPLMVRLPEREFRRFL